MIHTDGKAADSKQCADPVIIENGDFVALIDGDVCKLLWIARFLAAGCPNTSALTLPLVSDLLSQARQLEELLDAYGARNNRKWSRFRSLTATIKLFAEVVYELLHIYRALNFYRLLPIEHDFKSATRQAIERTHEVLQTASNLILAEATRLGLTPPADEHWSRLYAESVPAARLPHDRPARKIKHVAETVIYLATAYLNAASEGEILTLPRAEESENYATSLPDSISEDNLRYVKVRFHCLQSLYDTYVLGTETERTDSELPMLRGHISLIFHLLEVATYLIHYYERHLNIHTGDATLRRKPVVNSETLLNLLINYSIIFASIYLAHGQCLCYTLLKRYAEIGKIEVPAPSYRGFHVRPSTLIARIVRHYGSDVVMELDGQSFDASSPMAIFRANEKINAQKRRWLAAEIGRLLTPTRELSHSDIKTTIRDVIIKLIERGKLIIYKQPLDISNEFDKQATLLETVANEMAKLQATGQLDIKTELSITFSGDKRVLSDLELLAKSGYGEDHFGNNITLPKELAYLQR